MSFFSHCIQVVNQCTSTSNLAIPLWSLQNLNFRGFMETEMLQQISPIGLRHTFPQLLKGSVGYVAVSHLSLGCPYRRKTASGKVMTPSWGSLYPMTGQWRRYKAWSHNIILKQFCRPFLFQSSPLNYLSFLLKHFTFQHLLQLNTYFVLGVDSECTLYLLACN